MLKTLLKKVKKIFIFFLILGVLFLMVISIINLRDFLKKNDSISIIIDSGTGSDPGQLFAIARALIATELEVKGLVSSQWNFHPSGNPNSVQVSDALHNTLLEHMKMTSIQVLTGERQPFLLNPDKNREISEAAAFYIQEAHKAKKNEKINIVVFGALTNLASAIHKDPSIVHHIRLYYCGLRYDQKMKVWNKNETNVRYDLDALDLLLNTNELEMNILPADLSEKFEIKRVEINRMLVGKGEPWNFLLSRIQGSYTSQNPLILKEVGMIESLINPKYRKISTVNTPPENYRRKLSVLSYINIHMMKMSCINAFKDEINKTKRDD